MEPRLIARLESTTGALVLRYEIESRHSITRHTTYKQCAQIDFMLISVMAGASSRLLPHQGVLLKFVNDFHGMASTVLARVGGLHLVHYLTAYCSPLSPPTPIIAQAATLNLVDDGSCSDALTRRTRAACDVKHTPVGMISQET